MHQPSLVRTLFLTACGVLASAGAHGQAVQSSTPRAYLGLPEPGDTPVIFAPGEVSTEAAREINVVVARDGRELYFTRVIDGRASLFVRRLVEGSWTPPERLTLIAGQPDADIADPALSPDGTRLYFVSSARNDLFAPGNGNIWVSQRDGGRWTDAVVLPSPVNSDAAEYYPSVVADGSLYFSSNREGGLGDLDLYRAQYSGGTFTQVTNLGAPVNTPQTEVDAYVGPDERLLIVSARRDGNRGALDLYVSVRQDDGTWGDLVHLGDAVNTDLTDYCPWVTLDGRFFFSRRTAQGGDIYWMRAGLFDRFRQGPARNSDAYTAPYQRKALEIYRSLIGMRTAAGHGQVPGAARYLAEEFRAAGFPADDVHVLPFTTESGEETASLVVRYRGDGSSGLKPILLLAHLDVVDAMRDDWERDPFTLVEEDGYFYGRGVLDDKFGVASLTGTFLRLKAEGFVPTRDLVIAFAGDEETAMRSARRLVTEHRALTDAEFALNDDGGGGALDEQGRPVAFFVQTAEKTYATFELTITSPGGHSSTPRDGDNAIYDLSRALARLERYRFPVQTTGATRSFLREMARVRPGPVGEAMARLAGNPADEDAADVLWREPELVGITRTTCVPTMLRAGHAENALPQSAVATVNCRIFPGVAVADVQATLEREAATPGLVVKVLGEPMASPASPLRDDVMQAVAAAVHARYPGVPVIPYMAPYATDGKETRTAGIPTYGVMGVFMKDSDQFAHGLNERVPVEQFFAAQEHWKVLLTRLAGRTAR